MKVHEFMKKNPAVATPESTLQEVSLLMNEHDCGSIPVVESQKSKKLVGFITDRDIACRAVSKGISPSSGLVKNYMSKGVVTVTPHTTLEESLKVMRDKQVKRLPVTDENRECVGIVTQAHIARNASKEEAGEVLRGLSQRRKHVPVM